MICLAAGTLVATLAVNNFTLAWTHSIEKVRWEEDWRVDGNALVIDEARIRGSGAGMEPPENAVLKDGVWHYRPAQIRHEKLRLTHSPYVHGYEFCNTKNGQSQCQQLADLLPRIDNNAVIEIRPCD